MRRGKHSPEVEKGRMARRLVYYCIAILTETALWAQIVTTVAAAKGWAITFDFGTIVGAVLTFVGGAFGFELLALLLKRLLAKPGETVKDTDKTIETTDEEGDG